LVLLILLLGLAARALPARAGDEGDELAAFQLLKAGVELQAKQDHAAALVIFERALAVHTHPKILFYQARSLMELERFREARAIYFTIQGNTALKPEQRDEVDVRLAECQRVLKQAQVSIDVPGVSGVNVEVDGKPVGRAPVTVGLERGKHSVRVSREGYVPATASVEVKDDQSQGVTLRMLELEAEPAVEAAPPAPMEATPSPEPALEPVPPAPEAQATRSAPSRAPAWLALGGGVAVGGAGLAFLGHYVYIQTRSLRPDQKVEGGVIDLALGASLTAVGAGLGVWSIFLFKRAGAPAGAAATLTPLPGGASLSLHLPW
jgi:hypothetical protein